jgi:hypothetical protein
MKLSKLILENKRIIHRSEINLSEKDVDLLSENITGKLEEFLDTGDRSFLKKTVTAAIQELLKDS